MNEQSVAQLARFLRDLGLALHVSGAPAHDLEARLNEVGKRLGARVEGFAVLTFLALTVVSDEHIRRVEMLRLPPYDYNMARLIDLERLCRQVSSIDDLSVYDVRLAEIMRRPPPWSGFRFVGMGFLLSGSMALLLRGGWVEMFCGGLIGMFFVFGYLRFSRIPRLGPAVPFILCALAAMAAQGAAFFFPQQVPFISAVAAIVLLLPGFMLTVAMSELATQNYLAGTGRLAGAFVLLFLMGAGLVIGTQISMVLLPVSQPPGSFTALPGWVIWMAMAGLGISLLAVLQAPFSSVTVSVGACLLAWAVYSLVTPKLGNVVGAFAGSLLVASAGHVYQYLTKRPAALVKIPGLIALVPGSMGFRGVHALIQQDNTAGISLISDMLMTGVVLAVGMLLADNILPLVFERQSMKEEDSSIKIDVAGCQDDASKENQ